VKLHRVTYALMAATAFAFLFVTIPMAWGQTTTTVPTPTDAAIAALLGGFLVTGMTQIIKNFAKNVGGGIPKWALPIIAGLIATGAINVGNLHIFTGTSPYIGILNQLVVWALGSFINDLAL